MEKQSTRKFFSLMIAMVALFVLGLSGVLLSACNQHEHNYEKDTERSIAASCQSIGLEVFTCSEDGAWNIKPVAAAKHTYGADGVCTVCGLTKALEVDYAKELEKSFNDVKTAINEKITAEASKLLTAEDIKNLATAEGVNKLNDAIAKVQTDVAALNTLLNGVNGKIDGLTTKVEAINTKLDANLKTILDAIKEGHKHTLGETQTQAATCREAGYTYAICSECKAVVTLSILPALGGDHEFDTTKPAQEVLKATCSHGGIYSYNCVKCSANVQYSTPIDPEAHDWDEGEITTAATCTANAIKTYTCAECDATTKKEVEGSMIDHTLGEGTEVKSNDCTAEKKIEYKCTVCEQVVKTETTPSEITEHTFPEDSRKLTDCEVGLEALTVTCTNEGCEQTHTYEAIEKLTKEEHEAKLTALLNAGELTGTDRIVEFNLAANTAKIDTTVICPDCGRELTLKNRIEYHLWEINKDKTDAQEHISYAEENKSETNLHGYVNTSCEKDAYVYFWCGDNTCGDRDEDGKVIASDIEYALRLPAIPHDMVKVVAESKDADCVNEGLLVTKCSRCPHEETKVLEALGHTPKEGTERVIKAATCYEPGVKAFECARCGETIENGVIPQLTHEFGPATKTLETIEGVHNYVYTSYCIHCGLEHKDYEPLAEDHTWITLDRHTGGCENWGYEIKVCSFALEMLGIEDANDLLRLENTKELNKLLASGEALRGDVLLAPVGHNYELVVTGDNPCVDPETKTYVCKYCGVRDTAQAADAPGHTWIKANESKAALCDVDGVKTFYYCENCGLVVVSDEDYTKEEYKYVNSYYKNATTGKNWKYAIGEDADNSELLATLVLPATGHKFEREITLLAGSCTEPNWSIKICSVCGVVPAEEEGGVETYVIKKDAKELAKNANYKAAEIGAASADQLKDGLAAINALIANEADHFAAIDATVDGYGYNFTAVTFKAIAGHSWTPLTEAKAPTCQEIGYEASWYCAKCGIVSKSATQPALHDEANTEYLVTFDAEGKATNLEEIKPNFELAKVEHDVKYYKYIVTNEGNVATAVVTNKFVMNADESAPVVYTYEEIVAAKHVNADGTVNCYYKAFCAFDCGTDLGFDQQHTYPTPTDIEKYPNCQHAGFCLWCSEALLPMGTHSLLDVTKITDEAYAEFIEDLKNEPWWKESKEATCTEEGLNVTISVCTGCLEALKNGETVTWTKDINYKVVEEVIPKDPHKWNTAEHALGTAQGKANCLLGSYKIDTCEVCHEVRIETELEDAEKRTDAQGHYAIVLPKSHKVAPVVNYWVADGYIPSTGSNAAWISYICIECGARVQGYYGDTEVFADPEETLLQYTMATDAEIAAYIKAVDEDGNWKYGAIQEGGARPEDRLIPVEAATADDVAAALNAESEYVRVVLTADTELTELNFNAAVKNANIDLGGKKLTLNVGSEIKVPKGFTLTINNGNLVLPRDAVQSGAFKVEGGSLVIDGITVENAKTALAFAGNDIDPKQATGSIKIVNTKFTTSAYYAVATNASEAKNSEITIEIIDSELTTTRADVEKNKFDCAAVCFNVPGTLTIKDSKLTADRQGIIIRGGKINATIENTTVTLTNKYASKDLYLNGAWGSGNEVPMAAIVIGNRGSGYTTGSAESITTVTLTNVTVVIENNEETKLPAVYTYAAEGELVLKLTADEAIKGQIIDGTKPVETPVEPTTPDEPQA